MLAVGGIDIRHEAPNIKSKRKGTCWLGWTSLAADCIPLIRLGGGLGEDPDFSDHMGGLLANRALHSGYMHLHLLSSPMKVIIITF